ncbi:MAG: DMT family transporter [Thiogranum sp.]|jgi:drug/metabolite transporter (DMT)-like permease|nr:DMT family transporter [Thiogranum sp.]
MSVPAAFLGVILIWSTTPLAIQWSSEGGGFLFGVTARMVLGLIFCLLAIRISGIDMPWHARARGAYLAAGIAIYGAMMLVYWGAQYVPSGWIAVLFGLSPLLTSLFSAVWLSDHSLSRWKLAGLLLGVLGLTIIFSGGVEIGPHVGVGVAAVLLSTLLHSASAVWVKRLGTDLPALAVTGGGLSVAVPAFVLSWFVFDGVWPQALPERARFAISYLALFGSVLGFFWYYYLLNRVAPVKVNLVTLVTPVTALLLGHWLNGEVLLPTVWLGTGLILAGLTMHQWDMLKGGRAPTTVE